MPKLIETEFLNNACRKASRGAKDRYAHKYMGVQLEVSSNLETIQEAIEEVFWEVYEGDNYPKSLAVILHDRICQVISQQVQLTVLNLEVQTKEEFLKELLRVYKNLCVSQHRVP